MYRALRSYLRARASLLNAEAEKLSPSPLVMLTQTALPFLAGALHGYFQPTAASSGKASAAAPDWTRPIGTNGGKASSLYRNNTDRPGVCWICNARTLPGDAHTHTAESTEMWAKRPDWTVSPTPEEMAEEAQVRREEIEARGAPHEAATYKLGFEEGVRTERGRATMAQ